jgi:hypothetical protein
MTDTCTERVLLDVRPLRARCRLGGPAPCVDDLCHGVDQTICGLWLDFDVCPHGQTPETCDEYPCDAHRDDEYDGQDEDL